jgi:hypothetical protein
VVPELWHAGRSSTAKHYPLNEDIYLTMKISEQFAGSYFKAADLPQPRVFIIQDCVTAKLPDDSTKPALRFVGEQQQLILNKTNAFCLAEWFSDDTHNWNGRQIELYSTTTSYAGRMVPAIRVRLPQQPAQPAQQPMQYQAAPQVPQQQYQPVQQQYQPVQQQLRVPAPPQTAPTDIYDGPVDA